MVDIYVEARIAISTPTIAKIKSNLNNFPRVLAPYENLDDTPHPRAPPQLGFCYGRHICRGSDSNFHPYDKKTILKLQIFPHLLAPFEDVDNEVHPRAPPQLGFCYGRHIWRGSDSNFHPYDLFFFEITDFSAFARTFRGSRLRAPPTSPPPTRPQRDPTRSLPAKGSGFRG